MPSRGKRKPSAAVPSHIAEPADPQQDIPPLEHYPPEVTSPGLRRSARQAAASSKTAAVDEDTGVGMKVSLREFEKMRAKGLSTERTAQKMDREVRSAWSGLAEARTGLEEMELSFKRDIKRRKLQVEESVVEIPATERSDGAFRPRPPSNAVDVLRTERILGFREDESGEDDGVEDGGQVADVEEGQQAQDEPADAAGRAANRPPAVNSDNLPLPWKGRLGYACLNTYLRSAKPPVFSSRTCRIASIIDHRYPLADASQPEHATKNRPDKNQKPDIARGQAWVEGLGLANARDIVKMLRWNDKYGIKFMRLSSEIFPFASHEEYGYKLAPFASEVLAEAGKVAAELGHRLTTHPGQFTQLGSPRKEVVSAAIRDLVYHDELLSLLKLPPQQDRDAVMILHMGGTFPDVGGKTATLDRFRANYVTLTDSIKRRLVLENDDVSWSVHDLLPICEDLNIPLVLDYHHHNIIFDAEHYREGTFDISQPEITERIAATWIRKGIKQKAHYSEPCPGAVTPRDRRKHSPRVATLPPCATDMDLMIEAKDKEQAVFELMRRFKLPGHEKIADLVAHEREDQDRPAPPVKKPKRTPKKRKAKVQVGEVPDKENDGVEDGEEKGEAQGEPAPGALVVSPEDFGMGGPLGRVYWPAGFEEWLTPKKKERKKVEIKVPPGKEA